jgi:peroxiredoxin
MTLQDRLDAFKADFVAGKLGFKPTPERLQAMQRATAELIESGQAQRAKKAGDVAPIFTLRNGDGNVVSSRDLLAAGPLVVSFYRGVWCPYCNLELQALQAALPEINARGASLVAISPQTQANSRKSQRDNKLDFPILSDVGSEVANAFGIRFSLPAYLAEVYKIFGNNLPVINDDPSWVLPMPARYVIGKDGVIAYSEVNPDYTQRPDPRRRFSYGNPLAWIWLSSCCVRSARLAPVPSSPNKEAGLSRSFSTAMRGQCPALHRPSFNFSACATRNGGSSVDHASTIGSSILRMPGKMERSAYLLVSTPK